MKKNFYVKLVVLVAFSLSFMPVIAFAGTLTPPASAGANTAAATTTTAATTCGGDTTPQGQVLEGIGQTGNDCTGATVNNVPSTVVTILSIIAGIAAVIMIIISGFKYITSGGDSNGVAAAKNTLVYALVGLAVAALAQVLVHFVLRNIPAQSCTPTNTSSCVTPKKK